MMEEELEVLAASILQGHAEGVEATGQDHATALQSLHIGLTIGSEEPELARAMMRIVEDFLASLNNSVGEQVERALRGSLLDLVREGMRRVRTG